MQKSKWPPVIILFFSIGIICLGIFSDHWPKPLCVPRRNELQTTEWILKNLHCERHLTPYSSWIDWADYCATDERVGFFILSIKRGREPHQLFERVPVEVWQAFKIADSAGRFFANEIRKPSYRFRTVDEFAADAPEIACQC
jgi:hypothetical protein